MTILTINKKELETKIGKLDDKLKNKIDMFGTPIDNETEDEISIEIFPNRPDLLSFQGFVRSFLYFLDKAKDIEDYKVERPEKDYKVIIEKSVKKVRPYTCCAIVKGLTFNDDKIDKIIDIQEKLHASYGRNRKKLAIGIYPLEMIKLPIRFLAKKPEDIKFRPLEFPKEINGRQILNQHPKGREYSHLLKYCDIYPIFEDANNEVLSMPPIINSEKTGKITENTRDIFIECSGFDKEYLAKSLNIIVCALSDMGGKIYAMEIEDKAENNKYNLPDLSSEKMEFSIEFINKNLGVSLDEKEIRYYLSKMGINSIREKDGYFAFIPSYRTDIIHQIDLVEEIAISYGYDNFIPKIPEISTIGEEDKTEILKRKISEALIGLGLLEISTYHLSTKEKQFKKINIKEFKDKMIEILDSKTENNILRSSLIAGSIAVLSGNSDSSYPQKIFEIGKIFYHDKSSETGIGERERLCISLAHGKANFTEIKQILDYLMRMFTVNYKIKESENPSFIDGRSGEIFVNKKYIGVIGEINPTILRNNKILMPVSSLEINIESLLEKNLK